MNRKPKDSREPRADGVEEQERMVVECRALEGAAAPGRVLIAPWGEVESANGKFVVDGESAQLVLEAFDRHGTDLPIDYEHQSLGGAYASPSGQAPAAGWIRALRVIEPRGADAGEAPAGGDLPGLHAEVEWTDAARARLVAKEYRYLSPVVLVRKSDRRVVSLHSAALTNKPAIAGMRPIVNRAEEPGECEAVLALRARLGLPAECGVERVCLVADERLRALLDDAARREASARVEGAMRAGKLTSAQRAWAESLAMMDPAMFDAWLASAPVVVMAGRTEPPAAGSAGARDRAAVIASARSAYRDEPALALLTGEEAWVREALREAGMDGSTDER